jgi:hypothetical protein
MRIRTTLFAGSAAAMAAGVLFFSALPASASPADDAITKLRSDSLYVAGDASGVTVNQDAARAALNGSAAKAAVFGTGDGSPTSLARQIGMGLGGQQTIGVFVGTRYGAGSNVLCTGYAEAAIDRAVKDNQQQLTSTKDLTPTIEEFARLVSTAPKKADGQCQSAGSTNGGTTTSSKSGSSGTSGWAILGIFGVIGAGVVGALVWWRKRRDRRALNDARALIQPYYDRLANEIGTLQPGDNATARQALSDASERFNSAGSQMASATSLAQLGGARRSVLEGLQAARTARVALGLDPGPDLPPLAETTAPQLAEAQQVNVNGQYVQGYPQYTPGAPYYFAGGGGYAGGWYSVPFWQTLLIAEALSPGWGWGFGGWGGGGYGYGYDSGFDRGYEEGQDSVQQGSGGDWAGGGGGGGDWGGGGGGGDWGGGGGDWGGGGGDGGGGGGDW